MGRVRAARLYTPAQPLVVEEIELGEPADGEVVVDLSFGGVNPFDGYVAMGDVIVPADAPLPRTLGREAAGMLDGRPVLIHGVALGMTRDGVWASEAIVPRSCVLPLPHTLDLRTACTLPGAGLTAYQAMTRAATVGPADRVLVTAAAGGVGHILVALAHDRGAEVWGQTSSPHKRELIERQGADHVIVGGPGALAGVHPTVVFDALGADYTVAAVEGLTPQGQLISYGISAGGVAAIEMRTIYRKALRIQGFVGFFVAPEDHRADLQALISLVAGGRVPVRVQDVLPLPDVDIALQRLRDGDVAGKLVLDLAS